MPMIDVYVPFDALDETARAALTDELATVLLAAEGAPDTDLFRGITWVYVHDAAPMVGGRGLRQPRFRVEVTVPEGALSARRKETLLAEAHRVVASVAQLGDDRTLDVWVLVREVPEGSWGAGGRPVRYEQLRGLAEAERAKRNDG